MKIEDYICHHDFANELPILNQLFTQAEVKVTFWGGRVMAVWGYEDSISIDEVARKVLQMSRERSEADDLTISERVEGIEISQKLKNFYTLTDTQLGQANWFTRLLNRIREFTFYPYTIRFFVESDIEMYFRGYSENKFIQEFGNMKKGEDYVHSDGFISSSSSNGRITAREQSIRAKFLQLPKVPHTPLVVDKL